MRIDVDNVSDVQRSRWSTHTPTYNNPHSWRNTESLPFLRVTNSGPARSFGPAPRLTDMRQLFRFRTKFL